jgi:hypothetical protein
VGQALGGTATPVITVYSLLNVDYLPLPTYGWGRGRERRERVRGRRAADAASANGGSQ